MKKHIFIISVVFLFVIKIYPQNKPLHVKSLTKDDGLSSNRVNCICQDNKGFLWFGTDNGLCRYDGANFKIFRNLPDNPYSISANSINCIITEKETGNLYIGTETVDYYDQQTGRFTPIFPDSIDPIFVTHLYQDTKKNLWVGTDRVGLFCFDTIGKIDNYKNISGDTSSLTNDFIGPIYEDKHGNLWIGTTWGDSNRGKTQLHLFDYEKNNFTRISGTQIIRNIYTIFNSRNNDLWIGTFDNGLYRFKNGDITTKAIEYTYENGYLINNIVQDIEEDENGNLFIANRDGGLIYFDINSDITTKYIPDIYNPNSITSRAIISMYKSYSGIIWMGTYNRGVNYIDNKRKQFEHYKINFRDDGLFNNNIRALFQDSNGDIWVGTKEGGGLSKFNRKKGTFLHYRHDKENPHSLGDDYIFSINELDDNHLLIGTLKKGLDIFDKRTGKFEHFSNNKKDTTSILINKVYDIINYGNNEIWLATFILESFNPETKKFKHHRNIIEPKCFYPEDDNHIWIGTKEMGLLLYNINTSKYEQFTSNEKENSINVKHITDIQKDSKENLWIALNGGGISKMNIKQRTFKSYTIKDGLPINNIYGLLIDDSDNIWCSSSEGLFKFNPTTGKSKMYDVNDGLQGNEFEMYVALKTKNGEFIFGGKNGFNIFHPDSIKDNTEPPVVVITEFRLFNKPVTVNYADSLLKSDITYCKNITLKHWQNIISFRYSALNYTSPEKNKYAYMLEGLEEDWNYVGNQRIASYTSLPAGDYTFKVKASNNDDVWNEDGTSIHIIVLPPWWETWWFRTSLVLFIVIGLLSFYFYRVSALKKQKVILERKVFERTQELREANSQLEEKQEEILQQNEEILTVNNTLKSKNEEILFVNNQLSLKNEEIQHVNNQLKTKNEEIESQKEEIEASRDQLEKAFNNIQVLSEFGQKITATFDFDTINKMIYNYVSSLMDTAAFGVGIYNERRNIIDFPYFMEHGKPVPYFFKDLKSTKSLSVRCFTNSEEIIINDLSKEYKKYLRELPEVQTTQLPASVIHLPLIVEQRPIGTLTVNSFIENAYNDNDIANLRTLASYISIALDNSKAYRIIRSKNEQISGSIRYGKTIQQAMLPPKDQIDNYFENFIVYRPKDIVSGDFYWFATVQNLEGLDSDKQRNLQGLDKGLNIDNNKNPVKNPEGFKMGYYFIAVVDCTGHGVPGAFMSMIGSRLLNDIVIERKIYSPAKILDQLNTMVRKALRQDTTDNHDGMDVCLCRIQQKDDGWELTYAGAKRPLLYFNTGTQKIEGIHGTRRSIGGVASRKTVVEFAEDTIRVNSEMTFYLSTDGLIDQCNPQKRKFSQKKLTELLQQIHSKPVQEQKKVIETELDTFQEGFEQRDDITIMGVKLLKKD